MNSIYQSDVIDEAMFGILRRESLIASGWIRLSSLCRQWLLTGFRQSDLMQGLARLETDGHVNVITNQDDTFVFVCDVPPRLRMGSLTKIGSLMKARSRLRDRSSSHTSRLRQRAGVHQRICDSIVP
jgi:hypothetical protein